MSSFQNFLSFITLRDKISECSGSWIYNNTKQPHIWTNQVIHVLPVFFSESIIKIHGSIYPNLANYEWVKEGSTKKFTILFNKFKPNTVSSQLTLTEMFSGSQHLPLTVIVIKHSFEVLKISLLNRKDKPDASSRFVAIGISTDTRKRFALLSIFNASFLQISRRLSVVTNELSSLSLFNSPMWSLKVQLFHMTQDKTTSEDPLKKIKQKGCIRKLESQDESRNWSAEKTIFNMLT